MNYILGVDGGATKTVFIAKNVENNFTIEAVAGSSNYKSDGLDKARENIFYGIKKIVKKIKSELDPEFKYFLSACFGLSGYDFETDKKEYENIIFSEEIGKYFNQSKTIICNDSKIGIALGSNNTDSIIFISGTGSNCYGQNSSGEEANTNGWDFILGDQGSGYEIAEKGLRAIMKAYDGRGPKTKLTELILSYIGIKEIQELLSWVYAEPFLKNKIANCAKMVYQGAEMQDRECLRILDEEIAEVILAVSTVAKKLDLEQKSFDLVLMGSVFKGKKYFTDVIIKKIKNKYCKVKTIHLKKQPVEGALKLASEIAGLSS